MSMSPEAVRVRDEDPEEATTSAFTVMVAPSTTKLPELRYEITSEAFTVAGSPSTVLIVPDAKFQSVPSALPPEATIVRAPEPATEYAGAAVARKVAAKKTSTATI
jgi:hypothetical protein